jgi:hypothetical protein
MVCPYAYGVIAAIIPLSDSPANGREVTRFHVVESHGEQLSIVLPNGYMR